MSAKLKVFTWSDGFHAFTVAATSRPKALEAWGIGQDLFKSGLAHELTEGADRDAALASPGAVISRGLAVDVGKTTARKPKATNARAKARLAALQADLEALDAEHAEAAADLEKRRAALEAEQGRLAATQAKARKALVSKIKAARAAL